MKNLTRHPLFPFYLQIFCHLTYVILFFQFHTQERPYWLPLAMMGTAILFEVLVARLFFQKRGYLVSLASIGIANSVFLNMIGYGAFYWPLFLAMIVALIVKYLLRTQGRIIFNPSVVGVVFVSVLFPQFGTAAMFEWNSNWPHVLLVFLLGTITTWFGGTILLSYSYLLSYVAWGLTGLPLAMQLFPTERIQFLYSNSPTLAWAFSIFNFGNILFAFHGIGNPPTAPLTRRGKIIFGFLLGTMDYWGRIFTVLNSNFVAYLILLWLLAAWTTFRSPRSAFATA